MHASAILDIDNGTKEKLDHEVAETEPGTCHGTYKEISLRKLSQLHATVKRFQWAVQPHCSGYEYCETRWGPDWTAIDV